MAEEIIKKEKNIEDEKTSEKVKGSVSQEKDAPKEEPKESKEVETEKETKGNTETVDNQPEITKDTKEKPKAERIEMEKFRTITQVRPKKERTEIKKEFEEKVLEIRRVARVVKGGRRFKFRAAVVVGNHNGKIGIGTGKGSEVTLAVSKAVACAKKKMVDIGEAKPTIDFDIKASFKSAQVLLKPAKQGTGIIAGGSVRAILELAGFKDISSKMLGSSNKINNMIATFNALKELGLYKENK